MSLVLPVEMAAMKEKSETFFIECYIIELRTDTIYLCACDEDIDIGEFAIIRSPLWETEYSIVLPTDMFTLSSLSGDCTKNCF